MKHVFLLISLLITIAALPAASQEKDKPAYRLFTKTGKAITYGQMVAELQKARVVLFGELHDNPIAHWLQLEVAKYLHREGGEQLAIGMEMFETDVQLVLDEYLAGKIAETNFEQEARPWLNYKTDYRPLVRFAKEAGITVVATNVPRRYAAVVAKKGVGALDELSPEAKRLIAPLPLIVDRALPGYQKMLSMFGKETHGPSRPEQVVEAQALKDATMAHFILRQVKQGRQVLHLHGAFHSDNYEGIWWYLRQQQPQLRILTIATVQQESLNRLAEEHLNKADFIIAVPASMPQTH